MRLSLRTYKLTKSLIWGLYVVFTIFQLLLLQNFQLKLALLLCIPIIRLSLIIFVNNWRKKHYPNLLDWFRLATFIVLILPFLVLINYFDKTQVTLIFQTILVSNIHVLDSILVVLVGLISIWFAEFLLNITKKNTRKLINYEYVLKSYSVFAITSLIIIGILLFLTLIDFIGFGSKGIDLNTSFILQIINISTKIFLVVIAYLYFLDKYSYRNLNILFYVYLFFSLVIGFLSGMKENVLTPLILVFVPYFLAGNKLNKKHIFLFFGIFLFLYPLNNNYRIALKENSSRPIAFYMAVNKTFSKDFFVKDKNEISWIERYQGLLPLMYGVSVEQQWKSFKNLDRYKYLPVSWIAPRFILSGKPTNTYGGKLYEFVRGTNDHNVSITPSTYGWSYMEGGFFPLFISFFIYAFIICLIERSISLHVLLGVIIYAILLSGMIKIESDIYFRINGIFQMLFLVFITKLIFLKRISFNRT